MSNTILEKLTELLEQIVDDCKTGEDYHDIIDCCHSWALEALPLVQSLAAEIERLRQVIQDQRSE